MPDISKYFFFDTSEEYIDIEAKIDEKLVKVETKEELILVEILAAQLKNEAQLKKVNWYLGVAAWLIFGVIVAMKF